MNKEEFYNYLSNPELLSNISETDIDDIIAEFPYFQTAYILKAKILSNKKSIKFDNQIKTTSLYALDRRLLYKYINTNYSAQSIKEEAQKEEIILVEKHETIEKAETETVAETKEPEIITENPTEEIVEGEKEIKPVTEKEITEEVKLAEEKELVTEKTESQKEEKAEPIITETKQEEIIAESKEPEEATIVSDEPKQEQIQEIEQVVEAKKETEIIAEEATETVEEAKPKEIAKPVIKTRFSGKRTVADEILDKLRSRIENQEGESIADKILREAKERKAKKKLQVTETSKKKEKAVSKPEPIIEKIEKPEIIKEKELEIIKPKKKIYFVKIDSDKLKSHQEEEKQETITEQEKVKPIEKRKIYFVKINAESLFSKSTKVEEKETISEDIIVEPPIIIEPELEELIEQPVASYYNIEDEIEEEPETISPSSEMGFADWLNFVENRNKKPKETNKNSLIDKFISENPSISINVEDNTNQENEEKPTKKGTEDSFVTETLANIYIKQKHYEKAILAMEKLSLKYPQKNSYFANRINEIKNLIKE